MTNAKIEKILTFLFKINSHFFAPMVVLALGTFAVDAASYPGFIQKITSVPPMLFLVLAMVSYTILIARKFFLEQDFTPEAHLILRANLLLLPLFLFLLTSLWRQEAQHFPNYVFSTFHLNLNILQLAINFSLFLGIPYLLSYYLTIKLVKKLPIHPKHWLNPRVFAPFLFAISVGLLAILQLDTVFIALGKDISAILQQPLASLEVRRKQELGPVYDTYQFFITHSDNFDTLAVPPQAEWGYVGNIGFTRYYLYPRYLIHPEDFSGQPVPPINEYVLAKSYVDVTTNKLHQWPPFPVKASVIYLYNEEKNEVQTISNRNYDPKDPLFLDKWGIIKPLSE